MPVIRHLRANASKAWRLLKGGDARIATLLELRPPRNLFQPFGETSTDRYPQVFDVVAQMLAGVPSPRLLSFGCSTGEEVFSLARRLPSATIIGVDISPARVRVCCARNTEARLTFAVAGSADHLTSESLDAVFAMAVFRHGRLKGTPRCDHLIRFTDFERTVTGLARCLKPGGLLAIRHANFRFSDTQISRQFEPVLHLPAHPCLFTAATTG
jgi:trans-aconitate methyltransferase